MDANFNKCLVCEEKYPQNFLKFFKFPRDKSRSKMWLDIIRVGTNSPEVSHTDVKKHGRICAMHFEDSDFVNSNKRTLKSTAYPVIELMHLPMEPPTETNIDIFKDSLMQNPLSQFPLVSVLPVITSPLLITAPAPCPSRISDTFQCGRCRTQFNSLTEFMSHKRILCEAAPLLDPVLMEGLPLTTGGSVFLNFDTQQLRLVSAGSVPEPSEEMGGEEIISLYVNDQGIVTTQPNQVTNIEICEVKIPNQEVGLLEPEPAPQPEQSEPEEPLHRRSRWECPTCGKSFEKSHTLYQHQRMHTGERPFQCVICGRPFSQKVNMRKHMVRHKVWPNVQQTLRMNVRVTDKNTVLDTDALEGDRTSYACQYCPHTFSTYFKYKKHLAEHSDFKVYRCIQKDCDKTYSDLDEFLKHTDSHVDAEYRCHVCDHVFKNLVDLRKHQYCHCVKPGTKMAATRKFKCVTSLTIPLARL